MANTPRIVRDVTAGIVGASMLGAPLTTERASDLETTPAIAAEPKEKEPKHAPEEERSTEPAVAQTALVSAVTTSPTREIAPGYVLKIKRLDP